MKDSADNGGAVRVFLCLLCVLKHYCIKQRPTTFVMMSLQD